MSKEINIIEAMSMNRRDRRRLGKINRMKIPSINNVIIKNNTQAEVTADNTEKTQQTEDVK